MNITLHTRFAVAQTLHVKTQMWECTCQTVSPYRTYSQAKPTQSQRLPAIPRERPSRCRTHTKDPASGTPFSKSEPKFQPGHHHTRPTSKATNTAPTARDTLPGPHSPDPPTKHPVPAESVIAPHAPDHRRSAISELFCFHERNAGYCLLHIAHDPIRFPSLVCSNTKNLPEDVISASNQNSVALSGRTAINSPCVVHG
ncbi:hypothetical protein BDV93DRAFT_106260 [Ceratobasidium sp. AG-I]|nr:hypothetical protein BDV93DRAFT_106260 [Ceratobasidium sp. AG-I]